VGRIVEHAPRQPAGDPFGEASDARRRVQLLVRELADGRDILIERLPVPSEDLADAVRSARLDDGGVAFVGGQVPELRLNERQSVGDLRGLAFLIELVALNGRAKLPHDPVFSVLKY
jgi:hypothetical protein